MERDLHRDERLASEYCSWVPATTGMFRIRVRNQGKAAEDYVLVTN